MYPPTMLPWWKPWVLECPHRLVATSGVYAGKIQGYADVGLVVLRSGADHYGFQYVANAARVDADGNPMFTSYYDPATGKSTADAATGLAQFNGKKPCWTDPLSASGYVLQLVY